MDDDELEEIDLSAWEAPAAPDLADGVIARMIGTQVAPPVADPPHRRRWVIAGVAVATLGAVAGAWAFVHAMRPAAPSNGAVAAARPQHVALPGATADLDTGANVRWHRTRAALQVEQYAGTANWQAGDEPLVIDAGLASIEATGASLRVEVTMNASDPRVVAVSALTSAAVAMVTVIVYEGHVKVSRGGDTVIVAPGSTYHVGEPPKDEHLVGAAPIAPPLEPPPGPVPPPTQLEFPAAGCGNVVIAPGENVTVHDPGGPTLVELDVGRQCPHDFQTLEVVSATSRGIAPTPVVKLVPGAYSYAVHCKSGATLTGTVEVIGDNTIDPFTTEAIATIDQPSGDPPWGDMIVVRGRAMKGAKVTVMGQTVVADGRFELRVPNPEGTLAIWVEHSLAGKHVFLRRDARIAQLARRDPDLAQLQAAVDANDFDGARTALSRISPHSKSRLEALDLYARVLAHEVNRVRKVGQKLAASGSCTELVELRKQEVAIEPELGAALDDIKCRGVAGCDADALTDAGKEDAAIGQHGASLQKFEAALACRPSDDLVRLAFMSSCNSLNDAKSRLYYGKLSASDQSRLLQLCWRNNLHPDQPATPTPSCNADDLADEGRQDAAVGQHGASLGKFEAAYRCRPDTQLLKLTFMSACNAVNKPKATKYYALLDPTNRSHLAMICTKAGITQAELDASLAPPPVCDAQALKGAGIDDENVGQHGAALIKFEAAYKCQNDMQYVRLSFMAACNANNVAKARTYFALLDAANQEHLKQICIKNGISDQQLHGVAQSVQGFLAIKATPKARVFVDGADTGLSTPILGKALPLAPGKHKVTFVIGGDKFTYNVDIQEGQTTSLSKDLQ